MKKLIWEGGSRFRYTDVAMPQQLRDHEVLVQPTAVGICGTDIHIIEGRFQAAKPPRVLGHEIGGRVVAIGTAVRTIQPGDRVTIDQVLGCDHCYFCQRGSRQFCTTGTELGITADGGSQGFLVVPQQNVFAVPSSISDEASAVLDMEVWAAISKCGVHAGENVLVFGPGPAGLVACQIAKILGAGRVILAGPSGARMRLAKQLCLADAFISIDKESVPERVIAETGGIGAHLAIDCAGASEVMANAIASVVPGGRIVLYGLHTAPVSAFDVNSIVLHDLMLYGSLSDRDGWETVIDLVASGKLLLDPLITHRFPFDQAPAAYDFVRHTPEGLIKAVILL